MCSFPSSSVYIYSILWIVCKPKSWENLIMNLFNPPPPSHGNLFSAQLPNFLIPPTGAPATRPQWIAVRQRFQQFHNDLSLTSRQRQDGLTKRNGVVNCLNRTYHGSTSDSDNS